MFWIADDFFGRAGFDDLAEIHHHDALADVFDDGEVVRDEEIGDAALLLQVLQKIDDLGLDGDVEGADGFVADDQFGFDGQRAGDADALSLAAAEFVRVTLGVIRFKADSFQQFFNSLWDDRRFARGDECPKLLR